MTYEGSWVLCPGSFWANAFLQSTSPYPLWNVFLFLRTPSLFLVLCHVSLVQFFVWRHKTWKPKVPHRLPHTWIPVSNIEAWGGRPGSSYAHRTLGSYGSRTPSQSPKNEHDFLKYHLRDKSGSKDHQENHEGENNSLFSLVPQLAWKWELWSLGKRGGVETGCREGVWNNQRDEISISLVRYKWTDLKVRQCRISCISMFMN